VNTFYPPYARPSFVSDLNQATENQWTVLFDIENETEACAIGFVENYNKPDSRNIYVLNTESQTLMTKLPKNGVIGGMVVGGATKGVQRYLFIEVAPNSKLQLDNYMVQVYQFGY